MNTQISLRQKTAIKCECGFMITGNSEAHAKTGLKQHRKSALHKRLIELNNNISNGSVKDISGSHLIKLKRGVKQ